MDGYELTGRRVHMADAPLKAKYERAPRIVVDAPSLEFMLWFHLSTSEQPYSAPGDPHVSTSLGDLYFQPRLMT